MNTLTLEKHCWAEIDLTALRENYEYIRRTVGGPVCAVVKADAYGHGAIQVSRKLEQLGSDEELAARKAAWKQPEPTVKTGYLSRYARLVTSANTGAVLK